MCHFPWQIVFILSLHYNIWQWNHWFWHKLMHTAALCRNVVISRASDLMPRAFLAKTQIHHSNLCCTHTCACRSCSFTGSSLPALWLAVSSSSSGSPSGCRTVSLSALHSTSEPGALGHDDSLFWSRHLSRTWHEKREKNNNSGIIKLSLLKPSAHSDTDTHCWCENIIMKCKIQFEHSCSEKTDLLRWDLCMQACVCVCVNDVCIACPACHLSSLQADFAQCITF